MSRIKNLLAMSVGLASMAELMNDINVSNNRQPVPYKKTQLTSKQLKARKKSKASKKARKKQR